MLIDAHIHSKGISLCSRLSYREMLDQCAEDSVDGIVLTNHLKENYIGKEPYSAWKERYVEEYNAAREYGASIGVTVLFGVEVTLSINPVVDYALYGIDEQEFLHSPVLYALSQRELFTYCTDRSALLIQAHPYRNGAVPQDPRYLHGVEINCHPLYKTNEQTRVTALPANTAFCSPADRITTATPINRIVVWKFPMEFPAQSNSPIACDPIIIPW